MRQKFYFFPLFAALFFTTHLIGQEVITITDDDLQEGQTYDWTNDNIYLLDGFVYLEEGGVLNIEAGTVIQSRETPSNNDNASALIITRGAQIFAVGTEEEPIIFTSELDDVTDPTDLGPTDRGLWGGLIVLGRGVIAFPTSETGIEGIPEGEARALYGGNDDTDNSGILRYVSIRHGGAELAPGNEINGLTLGAVGSGTQIDHVEVLANSDDGIEFFGGTVGVKFATVAFCGDDAFDWDLGYRGKGQFWFALVGEDTGDNTGELDGADPDEEEPHSAPTLYNITFLGAGCDGNAQNNTGLLFRDASGGFVYNSIIGDNRFGIEVEDRPSGVDSRQRMANGELVLANNLWWGFCNGNDLTVGEGGFIRATEDAEDPTAQFLIDSLAANDNVVADPLFANITRTADGALDPRPGINGPAYVDIADLPDGDDFFQVANFKGAFGSTLWLRNWTALDALGFLPDAGEEEVITDSDLQGGQTYNWTNDRVYILDGFVYLEEGSILNIQEGTVIKARETPSNNDNASALIITRGAQIIAEGTEEAPIIFTTELDDVNDPNDLTATDRGLWGGLILLGRGVIAFPTTETGIEGIPEGEARALYGGNDDSDNSGVLRYVSIRHGGAELAPGNEINGLTLGAVGSKTVIEHVEVLANSDDGIEFFGGTVNVKFATVAFCGDDAFDWDLGYRGKGQFWFALVGEDTGDNTGELDGADPDEEEPHSAPTLYNITFLGAGCDGGAQNNTGMLFRDASGGFVYNSILAYNRFGIEVEDRPSGVDSRQRMENGELVIANNLWWGFCNGNDLTVGEGGFLRATEDAEDPTAQFLVDHLGGNANAIGDPLFRGISRVNDGGLDPRPGPGSPALEGTADLPDDDFFQVANYKGAFGGSLWLRNWTALDAYGFLPELGETLCETIELVTDDDLQGGQTYNWTNDRCYELDGFVYLEEDGILNIQEGTVILGREIPSNNDNASALIITRGAQIFAEGTAEAPIIFTSELSNEGQLELTDRGLWGGLILLGRGVIAFPTTETGIEGIPEGEARALYGGNDDTDNSGVLRYVSIRHGGAELAPGNEINGLTLGAVGSGTVIENVEVVSNSDDGIEFFGGTVGIKYASVAFCGDDAFDWDLGWRGKGQYWLALVGEDTGDNTGELDGADPDEEEPHSAPTLYNITFIGAGCESGAQNNTGMLFRDASGGFVYNSIFTANRFGIEVEDRPSGVDSRQRMENGELVIANNLWGGFCNGDELVAGEGGFLRATEDAEDPTAQFLVDHLAANANVIGDPAMTISRTADGTFNPSPDRESDAATAARRGVPFGDPFFTQSCFLGAFDPIEEAGVWIQNWTALAQYGLLNPNLAFGTYDNFAECGDLTSTENLLVEEDGYILAQNVPNPFNNRTQIEFNLPETAPVSLVVYDMHGRQIRTLVDNDVLNQGTHLVEFDASNLQSGFYYYVLRSGRVVLTKEMVVFK